MLPPRADTRNVVEEQWLTPSTRTPTSAPAWRRSARPALAELLRILEGPSTYRSTVLRRIIALPVASDFATLIAMADTDEVVRLRLLRAIRDLGV
jgi:hypothetical protein